MPIDVWPIHPTGQRITPVVSVVVVSFGDGYEQRGITNQAYTHADLMGGVTSFKGLRRFDISYDLVKQANGDSSQEFNKLMTFVDAHLVDAFYFYNRVERSAPDLNGIDIIGRYLVRLDMTTISFDNFFNKLYKAQMTLIEVRA